MNVMNILAGILTFVVGGGLIWGTWNPIETWIAGFDANLRILAILGHFMVTLLVVLVVPILMMVADDTGRA